MKLGTLVHFPTTGLDMTPFLAPRNTSRPSSATPLSSYKTQRSTTKSVHFEDEVEKTPKSPLGRSVSAGKGKGKRFLFPRKKHQSGEKQEKQRGEKKNGRGSKSGSRSRSLDRERRERGRSGSPEPSSHRSHSPPPAPGSESPTSVRSAPGSTVDRHQLKPHHRYFLPPGPLQGLGNGGGGGSAGLEDTRLSNVYDLFAVCNHSGTLSRGHYTAFCKNPADGRWYNYDDSIVQSIPEDQLVTSGAYMLFYVRQSLLSSSPLSSSESSQSSSSNSAGNHWIYHMPPFKLDLNDYHDELCQLQQQIQLQQRQGQQQSSENHHLNFTPSSAAAAEMNQHRSRLNSSNSVLSNPHSSATGAQHVSPPVSAQDVDTFASPGSGSIVNSRYSTHDARSDALSAVSLPPYNHGRSHSLYQTPPASVSSAITAPPYTHTAPQHSGRGSAGTRHQSLRLKPREGGGGGGGGWTGERRGYTPHSAAQGGYITQRSHEDLHSQASFDSYQRNMMQSHVVPTRSIPSLPTHGEMMMTPSHRYSQEPPYHFTTPNRTKQQQPLLQSNGHIPINIGTQYKSPSIARPSSQQPESQV